MGTNRLLAPPIALNTSVRRSLHAKQGITDPGLPVQYTESSSSPPRNEPLSPPSPTSDGLHLSVQSPPSPSGTSLDGDTLRVRSDSFQSSTNYSFRTRSDSSVHTAVAKSEFEDASPEEALRPDKGNEKDFEVTDNPFAFTPGQLNKLLNPKSLAAFKALGGLKGLERGLRTDISAGLSVDEVNLDGKVSFEEATSSPSPKSSEAQTLVRQNTQATGREIQGQFRDRLRVFKDNRLPEKKPDSIWVLIWKTYNDRILILLTIAALVSLALGLYETFSGGSSADWIEGVAICVAVIIVVAVGAANDWQKERQFASLNKRVSYTLGVLTLLVI